jgi:hypothetical protein
MLLGPTAVGSGAIEAWLTAPRAHVVSGASAYAAIVDAVASEAIGAAPPRVAYCACRRPEHARMSRRPLEGSSATADGAS